jgi:hypothetical protein
MASPNGLDGAGLGQLWYCWYYGDVVNCVGRGVTCPAVQSAGHRVRPGFLELGCEIE